MPLKEGWEIFQIDLTFSPTHTVISYSLILDYWICLQLDKGSPALGADIPPGCPIPVKACNQIGQGPFLSSLHKLLGMVQ